MDALERARLKATEISNRLLHAERVHILAHGDADGISAAAIIARALWNVNTIFDVRILLNIDKEQFLEVYSERNPNGGEWLLLDLGSSLNDLATIFNDAIIVDHHSITGSHNFLLMNPREINLSTPTAVLAYYIAKRIDLRAYKYSYLALVGARGDLHEKIFESKDPLIERVLDEAIKNKVVEKHLGRIVYDADSRPLYETIAHLISKNEPFYKNIEGVKKKLDELKLSHKSYSELSEKERYLLSETFEIKPSHVLHIVGEDRRMVKTVHEFATLLNACAKSGHPGVALGVALGDRDKLYMTAYNIYRQYRSEISQHVNNIVKKYKEKATRYKNVMDVLILDDIDRRKASTISSILYAKKRPSMPLVVVTYNGDKAKISVRGPRRYNLGRSVNRAAHLVGGQGGGHDEAAGATIPKNRVMDFLDTLASIFERKR